MNRRDLLLGCGTFLTGLVTGLLVSPGGSGGADGGSTPATPTPQSTPRQTATPTPEPTPRPTPTATPTPEPTPTPAGEVHRLGEQFTVGSGGRAITYRITGLYTASEIGGEMTRITAEGTFLVVVVELTNPREEIISIPQDDFRIRSPALNDWFRFSEDAGRRIDNDDRIDAESLLSTGVRSNESVTGAVAFDLPPGTDYRVWITPDGGPDEPEHFVMIGDLEGLPTL
jgi:hypothetical protein